MGDESYEVRVRRVLSALDRVEVTPDFYLLDGEDITQTLWDLGDEGFATVGPDGRPRITADGVAFLGRARVPLAVVFRDPGEAA